MATKARFESLEASINDLKETMHMELENLEQLKKPLKTEKSHTTRNPFGTLASADELPSDWEEDEQFIHGHVCKNAQSLLIELCQDEYDTPPIYDEEESTRKPNITLTALMGEVGGNSMRLEGTINQSCIHIAKNMQDNSAADTLSRREGQETSLAISVARSSLWDEEEDTPPVYDEEIDDTTHAISLNALMGENEGKSIRMAGDLNGEVVQLLPDYSKDEFIVPEKVLFWPWRSEDGDSTSSAMTLGDVWTKCRDLAASLLLPEGFSESVTSDYLEYSLWKGFQGIAAQISGVLATRAMLYAIGLGNGAIPTAAAVNWVLRDGIGYLSKIMLSTYGRQFDVNPKGWRLCADLLENAPFGMENLTPAFPHLFIATGAFVGAGSSAGALIQEATRSYFYAWYAAQRNFAEVFAKGEAQGMVSKSIGIMLGIALANATDNRVLDNGSGGEEAAAADKMQIKNESATDPPLLPNEPVDVVVSAAAPTSDFFLSGLNMDLMKERFSKLLLGEDMSGGGKGVPSALALSNAITNLTASVFREQSKLEPMSVKRKERWKKEIDWLLSITDYKVEFVPSQQKTKDGSNMEIPESYIESLPKNGRESLGESLYKSITDEHLDPLQFISTLDLPFGLCNAPSNFQSAMNELFRDNPAATAEDANIAVEAARRALSRNGGKDWASATGAHRAKYLRAIAAKITERKSELAKLEAVDCGKPLDEAAWDIDDVAGCFEYYADIAEALDKKQKIPVSLPMETFKCHVIREPIGVVGLITPW